MPPNVLSLASLALVLSSVLASPIERAAGDFLFYNLTTPLAGPCDLTTGPDGQIWGDTFLSNKLFSIDIATGDLQEYDIPYTIDPIVDAVLPATLQGTVALACVVQPGKDGNIYAAAGDRNQFVRINPETKVVDVFSTNDPLGNLQPFNDAWPGETGMFFTQTTANVITHFDYETEEMTDWTVPTLLAGPVGIIIGADGGVWFCEMLANKIGRLNVTDGTFLEYDLPATLITPAVMRAETEGRYLYFTSIVGNAIGRIDEYTGDITVYEDPVLLNLPIEDTVDSQGNVWFSTATQDTLGKLDPSTSTITFVTEPETLLVSPVSLPVALNIAVHYDSGSNSIWFTDLLENRVGQYELS